LTPVTGEVASTDFANGPAAGFAHLLVSSIGVANDVCPGALSTGATGTGVVAATPFASGPASGSAHAPAASSGGVPLAGAAAIGALESV